MLIHRKLLLLLFIVQLGICLNFDRSAIFSGSQTVDDGITVASGVEAGFEAFELVTINGDISIADSGQLCVGQYGVSGNSIDITSGTLINNGNMFLSDWTDNTVSLTGENFYNYGTFGISSSATHITFLFSTNLVNDGNMFIWNNDAHTEFEGPESGAINNGVITFDLCPPQIPSFLGSGCIRLKYADYMSIDVSSPFNQTLNVINPFTPKLNFTGSPLPNNNIVLRGFETDYPWQFITDYYPEATDVELFSYTYNNITGILNYMAPGSTYTFDIGTGFNESTIDLGTPGMILVGPLTVKQEAPTNCPANPYDNTNGIFPCDDFFPIPSATTKIAPYYQDSITEIISYYSTIASDRLPTTVAITTYYIPSINVPPVYTTTFRYAATTFTEVISYYTAPGTYMGLTNLPFIRTTSSKLTVFPSPYATTLTTDSMTVSGVVSFYISSDISKSFTASTTSFFTETKNVTTTVTEYPMGTIYPTSWFSKLINGTSTTTYSTSIETYVVKTHS